MSYILAFGIWLVVLSFVFLLVSVDNSNNETLQKMAWTSFITGSGSLALFFGCYWSKFI